MPDATEQCRRERILDAAEQGFAEFGFAGASLRTMVRQAKVNLATVYYYFNSKEGLMEAVLRRRFGPLRQAQLELLGAAQHQRPNRDLSVESILGALLQPVLNVALAAPDQRRAVARLIGRIATEPDPQTQAFLRSQHSPVRQAFLEALKRSLPAVPERELRGRLEFLLGGLAFILCNPHKLEEESAGACNAVDPRQVLSAMIVFFSPGFRAPASRAQEPSADARPRLGASAGSRRRPRPASKLSCLPKP
jgi:AcrR family transcriptional regulator